MNDEADVQCIGVFGEGHAASIQTNSEPLVLQAVLARLLNGASQLCMNSSYVGLV